MNPLGTHRRSRTALCIVTAVALLGLAACESAQTRRDRAMARGAEYLEAGNLEKARVEFQNALQVAPADAAVRFGNAQVLERLGQTRAAAQFYQGTIDIDPANVDARARLGRLYLFAGMPEEAATVAREGLKLKPDAAPLLTVRAAVRALRGDREGARADAEAALQHEPRNEEAIAVLAGVHTAAGRLDAALGLLRDGVAAHPASADLRLALAQLHAARNERADAERELRELVRRAPGERAHRIRLAQFLVAASDDAAAEVALREARAAFPGDQDIDDAYVAFLAARRGRDVALRELQSRVAAAPDDHRARFSIASLLQAGGDVAGAERVLREIVDAAGAAGPGLVARTRLATLRMNQGDGAAAEQLVAAVLAASPRDGDALIVRGMLLLRDGDARGAIADLRSVLRDQPNAIGVLRVLAQAHLVNREPALAEESLRRALEVAPNDDGVALDLGRLLVQLGRVDQGRPLLERVAARAPGNSEAQDALVLACLAARDHPRARAAVTALLAIDANAPLSHVRLGQVAEAERRFDEARGAFERALVLAPRLPDALQGVVRTLIVTNRRAEAMRLLAARGATERDYALPHAILGDMLLADGRHSEAEAAYLEASARAPTWWMPVRGRAQAAAAHGDVERAIGLLEVALPRVDGALAIRAELAQRYESAGRIDAAIGQYEDILRVSPDALAAANNLAMLLVTHRSDPESLRRAGGLVAQFADSRVPAYLDTYGWVKLKTGDAVTARVALGKAVAAAPDVPIFRYHLAMAQLAASKSDEARRNLVAALAPGADYPGRADAQLALARLGPPRT